MKILNKMKSLVYQTDILSEGPKIFINGNSRFRNSFGVILSSILIILSLVGFINFSQEIFLRYNPTVTFNQIFKPQDTHYRINTSEKKEF
jgi:hypothetical protein